MSPNFQCFAHVAVEGGEIPGLQARRYRENLQLTLYAGDLAVDVAEQIFGPFLDVALDPCLFVVDGAEDGRARQSDQRQHGREDEDDEPRLNAQGEASQECRHEKGMIHQQWRRQNRGGPDCAMIVERAEV